MVRPHGKGFRRCRAALYSRHDPSVGGRESCDICNLAGQQGSGRDQSGWLSAFNGSDQGRHLDAGELRYSLSAEIRKRFSSSEALGCGRPRETGRASAGTERSYRYFAGWPSAAVCNIRAFQPKLYAFRIENAPPTAKPEFISNAQQGRFSPDGRWIVYSDMRETSSGREVYVQTFPSHGLPAQSDKLQRRTGASLAWRR